MSEEMLRSKCESLPSGRTLNRRAFLGSLALGSVLTAMNSDSLEISSPATPARDIRDGRPNIIIVYADDMGWADAGYQGLANADFYETPNIDRLAAEGMIFNRFYPAAANCAPSRASMMTGMYSPRHRLYLPQGYSRGGSISNMRWLTPTADAPPEFFSDFEVSVNNVAPRFESLAEMLKRAGYISARFGKWHIGDDNQGFDVNSADGRPGFTTNKDGSEDRFYTDATVAERLTDSAVEFIAANRESPFFLYLAHWEPHAPNVAREERIRYFAEKLGIYREDHEFSISREYNPDEYDRLSRLSEEYDRAIYAAMIEQLDISTGRVMAALEQAGLVENTMVIFTSDNGGTSRNTSNAPLRAGKGTFYEGGIRTPFAVRWPKVIKPGSRSDVPINAIDLMPTFAEMASVAPPSSQPVDGHSIMPLLRGEEDRFDSERAMYFHFPLYLGGGDQDQVLPVYRGEANYWRAVPSTTMIKGDYKLIYYYEYDRYELFNLAEDVSESRDLAEVEVARAQEMLAAMRAWVSDTEAPVPARPNPHFSGSTPP